MIFELRKEAQDLLDRVKDFMEKEIYPSEQTYSCLLYTSPSPRDLSTSRMPSSA